MIVNMSLCETQLRLGATRCDYVRLLATPNGRFTNVTSSIIMVVNNLYSASSNKVIKQPQTCCVNSYGPKLKTSRKDLQLCYKNK